MSHATPHSKSHILNTLDYGLSLVCVCVCVCVCARARERESVNACMHACVRVCERVRDRGEEGDGERSRASCLRKKRRAPAKEESQCIGRRTANQTVTLLILPPR